MVTVLRRSARLGDNCSENKELRNGGQDKYFWPPARSSDSEPPYAWGVRCRRLFYTVRSGRTYIDRWTGTSRGQLRNAIAIAVLWQVLKLWKMFLRRATGIVVKIDWSIAIDMLPTPGLTGQEYLRCWVNGKHRRWFFH